MLEREVRANLVYRQFTHVGAVPDAKTLGKLGVALGPDIVQQIHQRLVSIAQEREIVQGRPCAWIPPWSKPTSTTRPTPRCCATAYAC